MDMSSSADVPVVVFVVAAAAATAATTRHLMWDSFCSTWKGSTTAIGNDIDIDAVSVSSSPPPPPPLILQRTTMIL
jgi:hypothetical protein